MRSYFQDFALFALFIVKLRFLYDNHTDFIHYFCFCRKPVPLTSFLYLL